MPERSMPYLSRQNDHFVTMLYKSFDESLADLTHAAGDRDNGHN
jgi:hypothetical protein